MEPTPALMRQIRDIQLQADKWMRSTPSEEALQQFDQYNEELRNYLLAHVTNLEIKAIAREIPRITEIDTTPQTMSLLALVFLGLLTLGISVVYLAHVTQMRKIHLIQANIGTARSKYATIEFLLKAAE